DRTEAGRIDQGLAASVDENVPVLVLAQQGVGHPYLARDHDPIGRCQRFASHPNLPWIGNRMLGVSFGVLRLHLPDFAVDHVDDFVRDTVANLVGMTLRDRFTGKKKIPSSHLLSFPHSNLGPASSPAARDQNPLRAFPAEMEAG